MAPRSSSPAVAYFGAVIALAWFGYRRTRTAADFIVAGHRSAPWSAARRSPPRSISAGTFVGTVGLHYMAGVCFVWVWPGAWLGWVVSAVFVAPGCATRARSRSPIFRSAGYGPLGP